MERNLPTHLPPPPLTPLDWQRVESRTDRVSHAPLADDSEVCVCLKAAKRETLQGTSIQIISVLRSALSISDTSEVVRTASTSLDPDRLQATLQDRTRPRQQVSTAFDVHQLYVAREHSFSGASSKTENLSCEPPR